MRATAKVGANKLLKIEEEFSMEYLRKNIYELGDLVGLS
jgi:hypothetical protein